MLVACPGEQINQSLVHSATCFFLYLSDFLLFQQMVEWGSLFVHQTVSWDMFHIQLYGVPDVAHPLGKSFFWESEHQVDTDIADADIAEPGDGFIYLSGVMTAMQKA